MKEIGILMQGPMVKGILEDRKTETRRLRGLFEINQDVAAYEKEDSKEQFTWTFEGASIDPDLIVRYDKVGEPKLKKGDGYYATFHWTGFNDIWRTIKCPYGKPGDILWVRETCCAHEQADMLDGVLYKADAGFIKIENSKNAADRWMDLRFYGKGQYRNVPSIHMPKWASRIWLKIKSVGIERLHDITEQGAIAEGVEPNCLGFETCPSPECQKNGCQNKGEYFHYLHDPDDFPAFSALESYQSLWEKINGETSWKENPWVWVIKFEVLSKKGKP